MGRWTSTKRASPSRPSPRFSYTPTPVVASRPTCPPSSAAATPWRQLRARPPHPARKARSRCPACIWSCRPRPSASGAGGWRSPRRRVRAGAVDVRADQQLLLGREGRDQGHAALRALTSRGLPLAAVTAVTGVAVALCACPAQAAPVIVVGLGQVDRVDDPFVPAPSDIDLGPAPGRPRIRAHSAAQGSQAVDRALGLAAQRGGISRPVYSRYRRTYRRGRATLGRLSGRAKTRARVRGPVGRAGGARRAADGNADALDLPPASPEQRLLAEQGLPGDRRPAHVPRQRTALPVLPRPRPPAPSALELQEGQQPERRLRHPQAGQARQARVRGTAPRAHAGHPVPPRAAAAPPR